MRIFRIIPAFLLCIVLTVSCGISKRFTYMQDFKPGEQFAVNDAPELKVHVGDRLDIAVTCKNPQLAIPFNVVGGIVNMDINSADDGSGRSSISSETPRGYLVDATGNIEFPVLGTLHIVGMTLNEVKNHIARLLVEKNYIREPIVKVNIINFKITMLGEIGVGVMPIEDNQINLLQAIAMAGGTRTYGKIDEVRVIRTANGYREMYSVNLKSKELYNSPAFYLQQDDIVYVMPKATKLEGGAFQAVWQYVSPVVSAVSTLSVVYIWIKEFLK
ncbi:MAG: polysaccharide biosynthesis/export family protein [Bacteroidales bacterium]|nr:polysaccharide biosynthesis/export family protein [Bacteroidales bacterium]